MTEDGGGGIKPNNGFIRPPLVLIEFARKLTGEEGGDGESNDIIVSNVNGIPNKFCGFFFFLAF